MQIKYVGPSDSVSLVAGGVELTVRRGETVTVPDAEAGSAPTAAFLAACAALAAAANAIPRDHATEAAARAALIDVTEGSGSGLLAQSDIWIPAKEAKTPKVGE